MALGGRVRVWPGAASPFIRQYGMPATPADHVHAAGDQPGGIPRRAACSRVAARLLLDEPCVRAGYSGIYQNENRAGS